MKRILSILLVLAMLAGLGLSAAAANEASFDYQLILTNGAGEKLSVHDLNTLRAGDQVKLTINLKRTDVEAVAYGIYGMEFQIRTSGLSYNGDGTSFREGTEVSVAHYLTGDVTGFAYIDMDQRETEIPNPADVGQWTYTVQNPANASMKVDVALVYVTGSFDPGTITTKYELRLDPNGGAIVGMDVTGEYDSGTVVTLPDAQREGYRFDGWSDGAATYAAGAGYTVNSFAMLKAQWTAVSTVTLDFDGGTAETDPSGTYAKGEKITLPEPTRDGYVFKGWSDGTNVFPAGEYTVGENVTLTALWEDDGGTLPPPSHGGGNAGGQDEEEGPTPVRPSWTGAELNTADHFNYVIGYPDGTIRPRANVTRAEVATIFYRLLTEKSRRTYYSEDNDFNDVGANAWFNTPISTLANAGILLGYPDGGFHPNAFITRGEMTAIITRFTEVFGGVAPFSDVDGHWAYDNIVTAAENGWIEGYEDGTFRPNIQITRAETMAMVNRMLGRIPETVDDLHGDMVTFPDNMNTRMWYYLDVQEAANNHEYRIKADGVHETWTEKLEDIQW